MLVVATGSTAQDPRPTRVFWGDTHVHTALSGDAFAFGTRLLPDDAYRFAKGEAVRADSGETAQLRRPLDFLLVADHAENLGVLRALVAGHGSLRASDAGARWFEVFTDLPPIAAVLNAETVDAFDGWHDELAAAKGAWQADYGSDAELLESVWSEVVAAAEAHNQPGVFTAFAGFEWSGRARSRRMIHRNVLFADGADRTRHIVPFSRFDSDDPEDLWEYLRRYEERTGGEVIAIPHNANLSGGEMFALNTYSGEPMTTQYARTRSHWEPVFEVTQIKGDGEAHPLLSPDDEFADFEPWFSYFGSDEPGDLDRLRSSFARSALALGLDRDAELGVNPFQFGMIGSTDSHTALATAEEDNFWGKMAVTEPSRYRAPSQGFYSAQGYAAVWSHENTRQSIFAALKRREVYATTGPRITVRFFGGWAFAAADLAAAEPARAGYTKGVPMGGELPSPPLGVSPSFLIQASKDPEGANLDRIQVIKGWRDGSGGLHERIHDVALSDGRRAPAGGRVAPTEASDEGRASGVGEAGDAQLEAVWTDPDFDPDDSAFYYLRVLEIPTARWTTHDAERYGLTAPLGNVPETIRERAYTSPVWYTAP